ncbi:MAG: hypothetical protein OXD01_05095 [Gammaproteobacteria bacterium]|nr:hypothetical protein [Gammaproteobacteria bacterium]
MKIYHKPQYKFNLDELRVIGRYHDSEFYYYGVQEPGSRLVIVREIYGGVDQGAIGSYLFNQPGSQVDFGDGIFKFAGSSSRYYAFNFPASEVKVLGDCDTAEDALMLIVSRHQEERIAVS